MFGSTSTVNEEAGLVACEIGTLLGKTAILEKYVKERYINVSRITGGATANSLGQLAQKRNCKIFIPIIRRGLPCNQQWLYGVSWVRKRKWNAF